MVDVLSADQRRRCMSSIGAKDTSPELAVRKTVHAMGYRYRLHAGYLPGKPDLVFRRLSKVIFVHGCFWHRHDCKAGQSMPTTNTERWRTKLIDNVERYKRVLQELELLGWKLLVIWQCEIKSKSSLQAKLKDFLSS